MKLHPGPVRIVAAALFVGACAGTLAGACSGSDKAPGLPLPSNLDDLDGRVARRIRAAADEVRADPQDPARWAGLGMTYEANELHSLALQCYARALDAAPSARWWYRSAITHSKLGQMEEAARDMRRSIAERGDYAPSHWRLGSYLFDLGRFDEARDAYQQATRIDPEHLGGWTGLARTSLQLGDTDQAIGILERILGVRPDEPYSRRLLKRAYLQAGRSAEAAEVKVSWRLKSSLGKDPWHREFRAYQERPVMERALDDLQAGRPAQAVEALEEFIDEHPDDLNAASYLAWGYFQTNRHEDAWTLVEDALERDPENIAVLRISSRMHDAVGDLDRAAEVLARIVAIDPNDVDAWRKKGRLERRLGRHADAVTSLRKVLELDQRDPRILVGVGKSELELGRWRDAARTFDEAIRAGVDGDEAHVGLARAQVGLKDFAAAEATLRSAPRLGAEGTELLRRLPALRARGGDDA